MSYGSEASPSGGAGRGCPQVRRRSSISCSYLLGSLPVSSTRPESTCCCLCSPTVARPRGRGHCLFFIFLQSGHLRQGLRRGAFDVTFGKSGHEAMCIAIEEPTFPRNTDSREDVVSGHHQGADAAIMQLLQHGRRRRLQLVLKNDEACKVKLALDRRSCHLLCLDPTELGQMLGCTGNDPISFVGVARQKHIVVARN